jgi:photosystem II stability/assembly factor-like uncharacterized protein
MKIFHASLVALASSLALGVAASAAAPAKPATPAFDSSIISGLGARNIGSAAMSGRISSLDAVTMPDGKLALWVGAASGGVWKSLDGATTFTPVFDDQPVQSIGAVEIDRRNADTVWVGTGEAWTRNSVSIGNGVYKTVDGGDTWQHLGLEDSERIVDIRIDPRASETVFVCVTGRLWSDSLERGVYRTRDGGKTWQQVLKAPNASTGCANLSMDEKNPDVLYAALWDFRRKGWTFRSGGDSPTAASASALMVTRDGGNTWTEIAPESHEGFAQKPYGRIAVNVAPSDSKRVYAFVESPQSALYVSEDGGATWEARDTSQWMVWRPFYFARMTVDPNNPDRIFKDNGNLILSEDAGRSFSVVGGFQGMHGDIHDVWVNPQNSKHVVSGDDGGLWQSHDGGSKWWKGENLPISQFYHVSVDDEDPYHVYGGLQDNSSWIGDSAYPGGITNGRWENMYGGDGFWMFSDPADSDYVYTEYQGGALARVNKHTHETRDIQPKARAGEKLRFNWNTPLHLSPNEKGTLYIGSQFLFRTRDQGQTWDRISPDLTTNDPQKQRQEETGGVTVDNSAAEMHTTIYSISESPKSAGTIWVGTDDGYVQLTRDGGKTWTNLTGNIKGLPAASWVSWVEASRHDAATAYATFDRHTFGDHEPWVYVTRDYGRNWQPLLTPKDTRGVRGYAHVIKEDLQQPNLLLLGTELGLWVSIDGGQSWAGFKGDEFPAVAVRDMVIQPRDNDLVIGTHGRGIWIIDDITPLRALSQTLLASEAAFISARPVQQRVLASGGWANGAATFVGENPPAGAVITYYQRARHLFGSLKLEILDESGRVVDELPASKRRGLNRVEWSMREKPPRVPPAVQLAFAGTQGPRVLPGTYTARMTKGGQVYEQKFDVGLDRRATFTPDQRQQQYAAAMRVRKLFGEETAVLERIQALRAAVSAAASTAAVDAATKAKLTTFDAQLDAVRKRIVATKEGGAITGEERLREHTDQLYGAVMSHEGAPGAYQVERIGVLEAELADIEQSFEAVATAELPGVNRALQDAGQPALEIPAKVPAMADAGVSSSNAHWLAARKRKEKKFMFHSLPQQAVELR